MTNIRGSSSEGTRIADAMSTARKSSRFFGGWRSGDGQPNSHAGPISSAADELAQLSLGATATVSISANRTSSSSGGGSKQPHSHSRALPSEDGSARGGGKEGASLRACRGLSIPSPATVLLGDDRPASTSSGSPPSSPPATPAPDSPVLGRSAGSSNVGSCRRLWESIRGGGRDRTHGGGRTAGGGANGVREVTVDSLVKAVMRARTGQPAIEAVREGLYCLDGRAVAALLKELAKNGLQYAASGGWWVAACSDGCWPRGGGSICEELALAVAWGIGCRPCWLGCRQVWRPQRWAGGGQ